MKHEFIHEYTCVRLQFLDKETNPGPRYPVHAICRILYRNVTGPFRNLSDLTVASTQYDTLLCSETWSLIFITYLSCWFLDFFALPCRTKAGCLRA